MQQVFLEELLEQWRKGQITLREMLDAWTDVGWTPEQMIMQLVPMLLSQAQRIKALERRIGGMQDNVQRSQNEESS